MLLHLTLPVCFDVTLNILKHSEGHRALCSTCCTLYLLPSTFYTTPSRLLLPTLCPHPHCSILDLSESTLSALRRSTHLLARPGLSWRVVLPQFASLFMFVLFSITLHLSSRRFDFAADYKSSIVATPVGSRYRAANTELGFGMV